MSADASVRRGAAGGGVIAACLWFASTSSALAAPGDHIRVGDAVITPEVSVGVEAQTNAYKANADREQAGYAFVGMLGLTVDLRTPKVVWKLSGRWEPRLFLTRDRSNLNQPGNFRIDTVLDVLPEGLVGVRIKERVRLVPNANDQAFQDNALITQIRNDLTLGIPIRPGPEFEIEPAAQWGFHNYRIPGSDGATPFGSRHTASPMLNLTWRFFPNTAFVVESKYDFNYWLQTDVGAARPLADSQFLKAMTGIRGRITRHFLLDVLIGYGFGAYEENPGEGIDLDGTREVSPTDAILVLVRPEFDIGWTEKKKFGQKISVTYRKDFQDSFFTDYVHGHHATLALDSRFGRFIGTHVDGGARFENYEGDAVERNDIFVHVRGWLDVYPTRYLTLRPAVEWQRRLSSDEIVEYSNVVGRFTIGFVY